MNNTEAYFGYKLLGEQFSGTLIFLFAFGSLSIIYLSELYNGYIQRDKKKILINTIFFFLSISPIVYVIYYWINRFFY